VASISSFQFGKRNLGYCLAIFNNISKIRELESYVFIFTPISAFFGCYLSCWVSSVRGRLFAFHFTSALFIVGNGLVRDK
jgi:hypothetical protein